MRKLLLLLPVIFMYSCTNHSNVVNNETTRCIDKYLKCDSVYQFDPSFSDITANLLYARWQIRKEEHKEAICILDSLESLASFDKKETLYQQIILNLFLSKQKLNELKIRSIEEQLDLDLSPTHNVNMLYFKARELRRRQEVNYTYATSIHTEHLRSKLTEKQGKEIHYLPWAIHSITLIRENNELDICKHYLQRTLESCKIETPACRWMTTLLRSLGGNLSENEINSIKETVSNSEQYSPVTDRGINTHLNYAAADNDYSIKNFIADIDSSQSACATSNFYNTTYLIDAYLALGKTKEAEKSLNSILICEKSNIRYKNLVLLRKQNLLHLQYSNSKNKNILLKLFSCSKELIHSFTKQGESVVNEHYADAIYKSNNIFLEALYELNQSKNNSSIDILNHLNDIKNLYNKVSDSRSVLGNRSAGEQMHKINHLKYQIEKRELKVNRYLDTLHTDMKIYEELYHLHKELYDLKSELPEIKDSILIDDQTLKLSDIDQQTQIIDYIQTDSSIFLSRITNSDIEIKKLNKKLVLDAIAQKKKQLQNKNTHLQYNYLDSIVVTTLSTEHQKIVFVPDGNLFDFPIEAIKSKTEEYLTNDYLLSYASQISEAMNQSNVTLIGEVFAASYSSDVTLNDRNFRSYPELEHSQGEVDEIVKNYSNSLVYSGNQFTEQNLIKGLNRGIVHISSHSKSSTDNPLDNYILIRDSEGIGIPLYGFALKSMDWNTQLVILSSCESGTGTIKPGAGIFSLSRDFLQAGAKTVIKSLWKVNEKSTSELMVLFHQNLRNGLDVAEALRQAKISLKSQSQYAHPYYWAGFILEGNPNLTYTR